jgi:ABC-type Fe3+/spermidine/putrescine transport system ATPase subunit
VVVRLPSGEAIRCAAPDGSVPDGSSATVMLRPERLALGSEARDGSGIQATVTDLIFQGATQRVILRTDAGAEIVAHLESSDRTSGRPGDRLWLTWATGAAYALPGVPAHAGATTTDVDTVEASL